MQLSIDGERFQFDGELTYSDSPAVERVGGLLMNARFIQGIFDDAAVGAGVGRERYARFGYEVYDPEAQTDRLIAALPAWYGWGLRAFTVGFQGGGPCFTVHNPEIENNPFGVRGDELDEAYASRMDRLIRAADGLGMAVIVSFLYGAQTLRLEDDAAVRRAVETASRWLKAGGYQNVIIEVANEQDLGVFKPRPVVYEPQGMAELIRLAREASGGMPVGCSGCGGSVHEPIASASDVVLIHGNAQSRQRYQRLIERAKGYAPGRPVVCNEDSPGISNLAVSVRAGASWGYYNNWSKQEPPTDFGVLPGLDRCFAWRMKEALGYAVEPPAEADRFVLYGLGEHEWAWAGPSGEQEVKRWPGLACVWPEAVDRVVFERDGRVVGVCYDDPFAVGWQSNWHHAGYAAEPGEHRWRATAHLLDGSEVVREAVAEQA
ncbi:MAG: hypothetical protein AAGI68_15335 [Planctomycetota bacterium]